MRKYIIPYKNLVFKVIISKENTKIADSFRIENTSDMKEFIGLIQEKAFKNAAINTRDNKGMLREWRAHNILYSLGICTDRTKDVDLNINQKWYIKLAYYLLSIIYIK